MIMHTDPVLTLVQWFSPAYPVGSYAYSHGLEWDVEAKAVTDSQTLRAWIKAVLRHGAGWSDALFLVAAYNADDPVPIDATARAFSASAERLKETALQGEAFARATTEIWATPLPCLTYPVAVGHAARLHALPLELTVQFYLQAFLTNLATAGMRLIPLGQTQGQGVIRALSPLCAELAAAATDATLDDLTATAFLSDIASMKHETQYSRIFRT